MSNLPTILTTILIAAVGCGNNMKNTEIKLEHFTVLTDQNVRGLTDGFACRPGKASIGIKSWFSSLDEAGDMAASIGNDIGFKIQGEVEIYKAEPKEEAGNNPKGYDIMLTPHNQ